MFSTFQEVGRFNSEKRGSDKASLTASTKVAPSEAAQSSNLGTLRHFSGATRVFATSNVTLIFPSVTVLT